MVFNPIAKSLILFGAVLIAAGILLAMAAKLPFLGRLPGDILIRKNNFTFFFPIATCIVISVILSLLFRLWSRR